MDPKEWARLGYFHLQQAILQLLEENYPDCIGAAAIGKGIGVFRKAGKAGMNDAIVTGILNSLAEENKAERCEQTNKKGGWRMTKDEYASRCP